MEQQQYREEEIGEDTLPLPPRGKLQSATALTMETPMQINTAAVSSKEEDFTAGKRITKKAGKHVLSDNEIW